MGGFHYIESAADSLSKQIIYNYCYISFYMLSVFFQTYRYIFHKEHTLEEEEKYRCIVLSLKIFQLFHLYMNSCFFSKIPEKLYLFKLYRLFNILDVLPSWVTGGLSVAGKLLPGLGIAMLLHYMPAKKYFNYILIGFVLSAYMGVPILGIAFLGVALAYKFYMDEEAKENVGFAGGLEDE